MQYRDFWVGQVAPRPPKMFSLGARWALGHGLILIVLGFGALSLGMTLPERTNETSEFIVGLILIFIGLWVFWELAKNKLKNYAPNF